MELGKYKKNNDKKNFEKATKKGLFISDRQLSGVVAGVIMLLFTTFILGYFWGQKYAVEHFVDKIHNNSLADQIYSSLFSLQEGSLVTENNVQFPSVTNDNVVPERTADQKNTEENMQGHNEQIAATRYYAQLSGFGTRKAANRFVSQLQQKNISVEVKKRTSKTAKKRIISWYQVVTKEYNDKAVLEQLVSTLKKDEGLKDPKIIVCTTKQ